MNEDYHSPDRFDASADERAQFHGYRDARDRQQHLNEHIARHGIVNPISIESGTGYVGNGMHTDSLLPGISV